MSKIVPFDINSKGFQPYLISFAITELSGNVAPFIYLHPLTIDSDDKINSVSANLSWRHRSVT